MDWLNYHHLLNFWLVAREGSVQKAAEALYVTPASVSVQVRQLERALGVKLLRKQGRGLVLTDMGEEVADYAREIFATGRELVEMVKGQTPGRLRELRVGIRDVMPKLVAFQLLQPALQLEQPVRLICHEGEMSRLVADLAIHKLDVVLSDTALDPLYKVQAFSHQLGSSNVVIMGTRELVKKYRQGFPHSLSGAPFLMLTDSSVLRRELDQWFSDRQVNPRIVAEFADSAMLKIAGRHGLGLFAVPECAEQEVGAIYGVQRLGTVDGVREKFFAVSLERRIKHPAVIAIREKALQWKP